MKFAKFRSVKDFTCNGTHVKPKFVGSFREISDYSIFTSFCLFELGLLPAIRLKGSFLPYMDRACLYKAALVGQRLSNMGAFDDLRFRITATVSLIAERLRVSL